MLSIMLTLISQRYHGRSDLAVPYWIWFYRVVSTVKTA